ncbi:hypothetical protein V6N12_004398 [Hibiscus sabdariffa]|uniref:Uncharacterized protein n=1 Tax=Hibiscus sabdariffa TaxID=183260 RepID=A0ABR2CLV8_9ROSI
MRVWHGICPPLAHLGPAVEDDFAKASFRTSYSQTSIALRVVSVTIRQVMPAVLEKNRSCTFFAIVHVSSLFGLLLSLKIASPLISLRFHYNHGCSKDCSLPDCVLLHRIPGTNCLR